MAPARSLIGDGSRLGGPRVGVARQVKLESRGSADRIVKKMMLALTNWRIVRCPIARARCLTAAYLQVARLYPSGRRRALRGRERGPRQGVHRAESELAYDDASNEAASSDGEDGRSSDVSSREQDASQPRIWRSRGSTHLVVAARSEEETRRAARPPSRGGGARLRKCVEEMVNSVDEAVCVVVVVQVVAEVYSMRSSFR